MNAEDQISQSERRRILAEGRRAKSTYHSVAASSADDERGGRYAAASSKPTVTGSSPIAYPQQPTGSPWASDPLPNEPPLGYSVEEMEPVGEPHEIDASRRDVAGSAPSNDVGATRPSTIRLGAVERSLVGQSKGTFNNGVTEMRCRVFGWKSVQQRRW